MAPRKIQLIPRKRNCEGGLQNADKARHAAAGIACNGQPGHKAGSPDCKKVGKKMENFFKKHPPIAVCIGTKR